MWTAAFVTSTGSSVYRRSALSPLVSGRATASPSFHSRWARFGVKSRQRGRQCARATLQCLLEPLGFLNTAAEEAVQNPLVIQRIADYFKTLSIPEPVVEYGHPVMMTIMVAAMGLGGAYLGWAGRLNPDKRAGVKQKQTHATVMGAFTLLAFLGASGGMLSVAMQGFPVGQSAHALSAVLVLVLLSFNGIYAGTGFGAGSKRGREATEAAAQGRRVHAYLGVAIVAALLLHAFLGLQMIIGS
jgi:hypothetical protein